MIGKTVIVGSKNMKEKILKFITSKFFVLGIQLLATIAVVYFTFKLDLVPTKYLIAGIVVLALLLAGFFGIIYSSEQKIKKGLSSKRGIVTKIISLLTSIILIAGCTYISRGNNFIENVSNCHCTLVLRVLPCHSFRDTSRPGILRTRRGGHW